MDVKQEVRDLLLSRRARITPEKAGLPAEALSLLGSWTATSATSLNETTG